MIDNAVLKIKYVMKDFMSPLWIRNIALRVGRWCDYKIACIFICIQNGVLRRVFGSMEAEVGRDKEKLYNEDLRNLYCSPDFIRVINSKSVTLVYRVTRAGQRRNSHIILKRKTKKETA
jgi:hypothetical protein